MKKPKIKNSSLPIKSLPKKLYLRAFTLVELIVVVVILAILATIAFLSFNSQSSAARNSTRMADVNNFTKALELYNIKVGGYPLPDNSFAITYSGGAVWNQGTLSDILTKRLGSLSKKIVDPLDSSEYDYSILAYGSAYQIMANYEGGVAYNNYYLDKTYAASGTTTAYIKGNYMGPVAKTKIGSTIYVLAVPSIMSSITTTADIATDSLSGKILLDGKSSIVGVTYNPNKVIFSGTTLPTDDTSSGITNMMNNIITAYVGTEVATVVPSVKEIVNTPTAQLASLGATMISSQLGSSASAPVVSGSGSGGGSGSGTGATGPTDDNWVNTTLLLHMDGVNGGTTFTDQKGNTFTSLGTSVTSTAQKKFGTASAYFDGSATTGVSSTLATPFNFSATGDWTVETWAYFNSFDGPQRAMPIINFGSSSTRFTIAATKTTGSTTSLTTMISIGGNYAPGHYSAGQNMGNINLNQWYHISVTRSAGTFYYFVDGQLVASNNTAPTYSMDVNFSKVDLGKNTEGSNPYMKGYIDDVRITKGVARYTSTFSKPAEAFPNEGGGTLIVATNGSCGSDNGLTIESTPVNLCSAGRASSITGSGPWSWTCNGINGSIVNVNCSANKSDVHWSNVSLLMHMDGTNNGTLFSDQKGNSFASAGTSVTSTAQKKYGTASAYFDGSAGGVSSTLSTPINFTGTGDWTVEAWVYFNSFNGPQRSMPILDLSTGTSDIFLLRAKPTTGTSTSLNHYINIGGLILGSSGYDFGTISTGQWYNITITRSAGIFRYFIDGQLIATNNTATTASLTYSLTKLDIGKSYAGSSPYMNGYIDDVRITNGVARYTSAFTPSTVPYSNN